MGNIAASAKSAPPPDDIPELGIGSGDPAKDPAPDNDQSDSSRVGSFEELPRKVSKCLYCCYLGLICEICMLSLKMKSTGYSSVYSSSQNQISHINFIFHGFLGKAEFSTQ